MNDKNHGLLFNTADQDYFNKCILHLITDSYNSLTKDDRQAILLTKMISVIFTK